MRKQQIKYTKAGEPFVTHHGGRLHLNLFERVGKPETVTHKGKVYPVHGWYNISYFAAYGINLSEDGETAMVFYKSNF